MKTKLTLAVIIFSSAFGNVFLSKGMKQLGDIAHQPPWQIARSAVLAFFNPWVAAGVALLALFFFSYLAALSWVDLSYVLPATAPSYLLTAGLSYWLLGEQISAWRWLGTVLIVAGVLLVVRDEKREMP